MDSALDPLDLVKHSARTQTPPEPTIDAEALAENLEEIAQKAAYLINADRKEEFLYKNPNGWQLKKGNNHRHVLQEFNQKQEEIEGVVISNISGSTSSSLTANSSSTTSEENDEIEKEAWSSIEDFEFHILVRQINEFILTWELSPATKFLVIGLNKNEDKPPFGKIYFVEAHFSKPTPQCPNPLAVAKVYFQISVSQLLPKHYPVNVTYKFEGYESKFYAMGVRKMSSHKFQRYYIDSILHMKLAFYAELCECRHPVKPLVKRKPSGKLVTLRSE